MDYVDNSGYFFLIYSIKTNFELNYHFDFLAGSFYDNATTLLDLPYVFRMELERASDITRVSPSDVVLWEGLGDLDLNRKTDIASKSSLYFNEETNTIRTEREIAEYFGKELTEIQDEDYGRIIMNADGSLPTKNLNDLHKLYKIDVTNRNNFDSESVESISTQDYYYYYGF